MEKKFEDEFDVIVIGTGLTESIVAAACSRIGRKVLHLDPHDYYGDLWANLHFDKLINCLEEARDSSPTANRPPPRPERGTNIIPDFLTLEANERFIPWGKTEPVISNVETNSYIPVKEVPGDEDESNSESDDEISWTIEKFKSFNNWGLDLVPRLLFSKGAMAKLLSSSNVCRYLSFTSRFQVLACLPGTDELVTVPCTRQDVFNDRLTSLIEKRVMMRLISTCIEHLQNPERGENYEGFEDQPFIDYLRNKNFTPLLQHLVLNSVAMCEPSTPTQEAMECLKNFIRSSGVFGNSPFIFPFYGSGEIPQAFSRLCAVFGGTYCLRQPMKGLCLADGHVKRVLVENQDVKCKYLVTSLTNCPRNLLAIRHRSLLSRAMFISAASIKDDSSESLLRFPGPFPIFVIEVSYKSVVVPEGLFVVYAWCDSFTGNAKKDLLPIAGKLFRFESDEGLTPDSRPQVLWSCYYNQTYIDCSTICNSFKNIFVTSPPCNELDYEVAISEANQIFKSICPDEEFLPRAPDHNEIVIEEVPKDSE